MGKRRFARYKTSFSSYRYICLQPTERCSHTKIQHWDAVVKCFATFFSDEVVLNYFTKRANIHLVPSKESVISKISNQLDFSVGMPFLAEY